MICKYCGNEMELDDIDKKFEGCEDRYYVCNHCYAAGTEKIRYFKLCGKEYTPPDYAFHKVNRTEDGQFWVCEHCGEKVPCSFYSKRDLEQLFCQKAYDDIFPTEKGTRQ